MTYAKAIKKHCVQNKYNYYEVENKSNNISHNKTLPTLNLLS